MRIPTRINVMGVEFEVRQVGKLEDYGQCDGAERLIKLRRNMSDEHKASVLLHEVIHAVLYASGHSARMSDEEEESLVLALEHGLAALYQLKEDPCPSK